MKFLRFFTEKIRLLTPYWAVAFIYVIFTIALKFIEWLNLAPIEGANSGNLLLRAITYNLIIAAWVVIIGAVVHFWLQKWLPKAARGIAVAWFSLLIIAELGLSLYSKHNGYMLDCELWLRPFNETVVSVIGAMGIVMPILIIIGIPTLTAIGSFFLQRLPKLSRSALPFTAIFFLLSLIFQSNHLLDKKSINFTHHRTYFLLVETKDYIINAIKYGDLNKNCYQVPYDEAKIDQFLSYHPQWQVEDRQYPLERVDNTPDVLSPFFKSTDQPVDVMLILVESLGGELMGIDCMPFVDSLAHTGLYWQNCLSNTGRSWAALPALTGSVNGPRGFQFSTMPDFNSLYAICNQNHYQTNHFYAGYHEFDCIFEYLQEQKVKYLSTFFEDFKNDKDNQTKNWWGYQDRIVFSKTLDILKQQTSPHFSSITTMTMHENLNIDDKEEQKRYEQRAKANKQIQQKMNNRPATAAAAMYTDDALRKLFQQYRRTMPNYENTIFIITGDHASGYRYFDNDLQPHHVPLIIWSPLLNEARQFQSLVTHNDLAPSLCQLMKNKYKLATPRTVHWLGESLDTAATMNKERDMLIVNYNRVINEIVTGQYYYFVGDKWKNEQVNVIGDDLSFTPINDPKILEQCRQKLEVYKYIFSYTYYNNRLTKHPIYPKATFFEHAILHRAEDIHFQSPPYPPSEGGSDCWEIFSNLTFDKNNKYNQVQLTLKADVQILDEGLAQDNYPILIFHFIGDKNIWEGNNLSKLLNVERPQIDSIYPLQISKVFNLTDNSAQHCNITLCSEDKDDNWLADKRLLMKNITLTIAYANEH